MIKRKIVLSIIILASSLGIIAYMGSSVLKPNNAHNSSLKNSLESAHLEILNSKIPILNSNSPVENLVYTSHYLSKLQGASKESHFRDIKRSWANLISKNSKKMSSFDLKTA